MIRDMIEDIAALMALTLFIATIAMWAMVLQ